MCKAVEDYVYKATERLMIENAKEMLADNLPLEKVAKYPKLPIEKVRELAESKTA